MRTAFGAVFLLLCLLVLGWAIDRNQQFETHAAEERRWLKSLKASKLPKGPGPAPIQQAFVPGSAAAKALWVQLNQVGAMRLDTEGDWVPFTAQHLARLDRPGFVWQAQMQMMPLVPVKVVDAFVQGAGRLDARIGGFLSVAKADGAAVSLGQLYRYFAELAWAPQALLYLNPEQWNQSIDGWRLAFSKGGHSGEIWFQLDEQGRIASIKARRPNLEAGKELLWVGRFRDYRLFEGVMLPAYGEVGWVVDGQEQLYWKGRIISVKFGP